MPKECDQTIKEFQLFDATYQEMNYFLHTLDKVHNEVRAELPQKVVEGLEDSRTAKVFKGIRERMAHEKFVEAKHINIELFKYSMEIIDREEQEEKEKKKPMLKKEPSLFENLTGIQSTSEHLIVNVLLFLLLIGIWMYFREDFYKYMFG